MPFVDMPLQELRTFKPSFAEPSDFDAFWGATMAESRARFAPPVFERIDAGLKTIETYDVTFSGFQGQPIKGWLQLPAGGTDRLPCVVEYLGYGGGRGFPADWLLIASAGYAHFVMDTRGQGSGWMRGDTPDAGSSGAPAQPGFFTRGILDPGDYYFRRVYTDGVLAVEAARRHPRVDPSRVAVTGVSQGGGICLAVAALAGDVLAALPDVPGMCAFERATQITDSPAYLEIARFCSVHRDKAELAFKNLLYFDGVNFSKRSKAPALFSVGLMDDMVPPSTVFAAFNHYAGPKDIKVWPYNHHEGGGTHQAMERLAFLRKQFGG